MNFYLIDIHIKFYIIYISFKLNYVPFKIHKYVNFKICIEKSIEILIFYFWNLHRKIPHQKF